MKDGNGRTLYGAEIMNNPYFGGCNNFSGIGAEGWDPCFVTFCTKTAKVPAAPLPSNNDSALYWFFGVKDKGFFRGVSEISETYQPGPGDIVFFQLGGNADPDRIGIISEVELNNDGALVSLTAIEGDVKENEGDAAGKVAYCTYAGDKLAMIYGFATTPKSTQTEIKPAQDSVTLNLHITAYHNRSVEEPGLDLPNQHQNYLTDRTETVTVPADEVFEYISYEGADQRSYSLVPASYFEDSMLLKSAGYTYDPAVPCPLHYGWDPVEMAAQPVNYWGGASRELRIAEYAEYEGKPYVKLYVNAANAGADTKTVKHIYFAELKEAKDSVSPGNTTINLFGYWTGERDAVDCNLEGAVNAAAHESGINAGHHFKFYWDGAGLDELNNNTQQGGVMQGIVKNQLGADGYPQFSGRYQTEPVSEESLAYLFDLDYQGPETDCRAAYSNVQNLLSHLF